MNKRLKQQVSKLRDAFRVEALEPRVLLSADPIVGIAHLILPDENRHDQLALDAYQAAQTGTYGPAPVSANLVDQVLAASMTPRLDLADPHLFDLAKLADSGAALNSEFTVAANDVLKGSGNFNVSIINSGTVAPGYSPGMQNVDSYVQGANATLQIELGGLVAGTGYDQFNVANLSKLNGKLEVTLWNGFKPSDGDVFEFMTFGTVEGQFTNATGLVQADDNIFFELVQDTNSLKLITHVLDPLTQTLIDTVGGDMADGVGYFLNNDYFPSIPPLSFTGSLNLNGNLFLDGQMTIDYSDQAVTNPVTGQAMTANVWLIGFTDATGFIGVGGPGPDAVGLSITDADVSFAFVEPAAGGTYGWVMAQGMIGSVGIVGVNGLTIAATNLAFDLAYGTGKLVGGLDNNTSLDLSGTPLSIDGVTFNGDGKLGEYLLVAGSATLVMGDLSLTADLGVSVADGNVLIAGDNVVANFSAGGVTVGLADGAFGLALVAGGGFAFEGSGALALSGGSFASVSADSAALRLNRTGDDWSGRKLDFAGGYSYTFGELGANTALEASATGMRAVVDGVFDLEGDFAFAKQSGAAGMAVIGQNVRASLGAGNFGVGVEDGSFGMLINGAGTVLEASGAVYAQLGSAVGLSADSVNVRYNGTAADASGLAITAGGLSHVFGAGLMASLQEVAIGGASLQVGGFVHASGNLAVRRTSGVEVTLADGTKATVDQLTFGAADVNVFAGAGAGTADQLGVKMTDVDLALVMMSEQGAPAHSWTALKASAGSAEMVGLSELTLHAADIVIELNKANFVGGEVIDFSAAPVTVITGPGTDVDLDFDGDKGALTAVAIGRATLAVSDYVYISGSLYLEQSATTDIDVITGLPNGYPAGASPALVAGLDKITGLSADHKRIDDLQVSTLMLSATDVDVFAGLGPYFIDDNANGLFDADESVNPDRVGFTLDDIDIALVLMNATLSADPNNVVPNFFAMKVIWDSPFDLDMDQFKFKIEQLTLDVNQGGAWKSDTSLIHPYVDFASSFDGGLTIPVAAGDAVVIDYSRAYIGVTLDDALLNVADMFQISGDFAFEKSTGVEVDVETGLPLNMTGAYASLGASLAKFKADGYLSADNARFEDLPVDMMSFGASNVSVVIGNPGDPLFTLDEIDIGFVVMHASRSIDPTRLIPNMYAMKANWAHPLDVDWGFMQLQIDDLTMSLNKGANWRGLTVAPHVDFISSFGAAGMQVATGGDQVMLDYSRSMIGVQVAKALITIDDYFHIEGGFALEKAAGVKVDIVTGFSASSPQAAAKLAPLVTTGEVSATDFSRINDLSMSSFTLGLSDAKMFVGAGPYFVDDTDVRSADATGLVLENLDLGLVVYKDARNIVPRLWALSATADELKLTGLDFLTMQAEGISVRANSGAVWAGTQANAYVDFVSTYGAGGLEVSTGNAPVVLPGATWSSLATPSPSISQ